MYSISASCIGFPYAATLYFVLTQKLKAERSRPANRTNCYALVIFLAPTQSSGQTCELKLADCIPDLEFLLPHVETTHLEEPPHLSFLFVE